MNSRKQLKVNMNRFDLNQDTAVVTSRTRVKCVPAGPKTALCFPSLLLCLFVCASALIMCTIIMSRTLL